MADYKDYYDSEPYQPRAQEEIRAERRATLARTERQRRLVVPLHDLERKVEKAIADARRLKSAASLKRLARLVLRCEALRDEYERYGE